MARTPPPTPAPAASTAADTRSLATPFASEVDALAAFLSLAPPAERAPTDLEPAPEAPPTPRPRAPR